MKARAVKRPRSPAGRPRKAGPRHACGKLIQTVEPNPRVVQRRQLLLGGTPADLSTAENPMSLALARGWLSDEQHRAGAAYARAWRRSHPQRRLVGELPEAPDDAVRDLRPLRQLAAAEIAAAFDAILETTRAAPSEDSEAQARARYNAMSRAMSAEEQNEVFLCFCLQSWPQWIVHRCAGEFDSPWERKRRLLVAGLDALTPRRGR